ncbi:MAG TPA: DUF4345 domain-containing protein [Caulobacteraceae bacterium]
MILALRVLHAALGLAAIAICLSILLLGPAATAGFTEARYEALTGGAGRLTGPWPATMDSELRFFAPFWGAFGLAALAVARDPRRRRRWVPILAAVFFAGGIGRAISLATVGAPHPVFTLLMAIELVLPLICLALWRVARF